MLVIIIDESGDLGFILSKTGTSRHFTLTALVIHNRHAQMKIEKAVLHTLQRKIHSSSKKTISELKGTRTSAEVKAYFWRKLRNIPFEIYTVVLEKDKSYPRFTTSQQERLYRRMTRLLVDMIPLEEENTVVHVEVDSGRKHRDEFNKDVLLYIDGQILPTVNRFIRHLPSEESKLIQATDLFAWGIAQKYRQGRSDWYEIFKHKIQGERIIRISQQQK